MLVPQGVLQPQHTAAADGGAPVAISSASAACASVGRDGKESLLSCEESLSRYDSLPPGESDRSFSSRIEAVSEVRTAVDLWWQIYWNYGVGRGRVGSGGRNGSPLPPPGLPSEQMDDGCASRDRADHTGLGWGATAVL